jgi:hypothetical protein
MFCGNFKSANHVHLFQEFKTLDSEEPKLNHLAHVTSQATSTEVSAGDLVAAIIEQYVAAAKT